MADFITDTVMTVQNPLVSVIVLTRNRLHFLRDAVRTLQEQDYPAYQLEIIVVNDGSSDGTRHWLDREAEKNPHIRAVHREPLGIPSARNTGVCTARGEIVAIVADDYLLAPDYVATCVRFFNEHPEASVVRFSIIPSDRWPGSILSHLYYEISFRKRLYPPPPKTVAESTWRSMFRKRPPQPEAITTQHKLEAAGAAAYRRKVFEQVGLFDESLKRAEDTDFGNRLRAADIPIYYYPFHKIRHRYGRSGLDTLKKNYRAGYYAARLRAKQPAHHTDGDDDTPHIFHRICLLIQRIREVTNPVTCLLLLPGLFVLESAWQLGSRHGTRSNKKRSRSKVVEPV